jgi:hypothetical protein
MIDVRDVVVWVNSKTHEVGGKSEDDARHRASSHVTDGSIEKLKEAARNTE